MAIVNKIIHRFIKDRKEYESGGEYYNQIIPTNTQIFSYKLKPGAAVGSTSPDDYYVYYVLGTGSSTYLQIANGQGKDIEGNPVPELSKEYLISSKSQIESLISEVMYNGVKYTDLGTVEESDLHRSIILEKPSSYDISDTISVKDSENVIHEVVRKDIIGEDTEVISFGATDFPMNLSASSNNDITVNKTKHIAIKEDVEASIATKQDILTAGSNIQIANNVISATDTVYTAGSGLTLNNTTFAVDTTVIQPLITTTNKLSSDLVDDTDHTNKFVTTSEKNTWTAKQNALQVGSNIQIDTLTDTISATDTTYTAGNGLTLSGTVFSANVENSVASTSTTNALSANMGKELNDRLNNVEGRGRYLSQWNATTGLPLTNPTTSPYLYRTGDYYIVSNVGATNYKPTGSSYTIGIPSTLVETEEVMVNDTYFYDGTTWILQINQERVTTFANITGQPEDNSNLATSLNSKVNKNNDIIASTKCKITYDAKGLVTNGADLAESDIPSLHLSKISDVSATNTEVNYLSGTTSNVQTQLDSKVAKNSDITGSTKCKITYDAKGLVTSGSNLAVSDIPNIPLSKISDVSVSSTEVNYLSGTTSAVQTQLDSKAADSNTVHKTGNETIAGDKIFSGAGTFSGNLFKKSITMDITTIPSSNINNNIIFRDTNNSSTGFVVSQHTTTNYLQTYIQATDGGSHWSPSLGSSIKADGTDGRCFSNYNPPAGSNDNSIATTAWVKSAIPVLLVDVQITAGTGVLTVRTNRTPSSKTVKKYVGGAAVAGNWSGSGVNWTFTPTNPSDTINNDVVICVE